MARKGQKGEDSFLQVYHKPFLCCWLCPNCFLLCGVEEWPPRSSHTHTQIHFSLSETLNQKHGLSNIFVQRGRIAEKAVKNERFQEGRHGFWLSVLITDTSILPAIFRKKALVALFTIKLEDPKSGFVLF